MTKKIAPEVLAGKVNKNEDGVVLDEEVLELLKDVNDSTVLEVNGGIGEVSEYLSKNNTVSLTEERRLCFVFLKNLFKDSTVVEMNINWRKFDKNQYYDYVIIHEGNDLSDAKKLARVAVIDLFNMKVVENEKVNSNNTKVARENTALVVDTGTGDPVDSVFPEQL